MGRSLMAAIILVAALLFSSTSGTPQAGACPGVAYLSLGPNGNPNSTLVPGIPRGAYRINIRYPAQVEQGDYSRSVGKRRLTEAAHSIRRKCPGVHLSVRAFSLGASAASLATDTWIGGPLGWNTDAVFYGNPRNRGNGRYAGVEAAGLPNIPGVYTWYGMRRAAWWIRDVCHTNPRNPDGVCWTPRPWNRNMQAAWNGLAGYAGNAHRY